MKNCGGTIYTIDGKKYCVGEKKMKNGKIIKSRKGTRKGVKKSKKTRKTKKRP